MAYANNNGVQIYYEVEGSGEPLLFHHGIASSGENWVAYTDAFKDSYQCIRIDARGHGKSDKLQDAEDYRLELMTSDVVSVLDDLGIEKVNFFGFSMGGFLGAAMSKYYPNRLKTLMVGGISPKGAEEGNTINDILKEAFRVGADLGAVEYINHTEEMFGAWSEQEKASILSQSKKVFQAYYSALASFQKYDPDCSAEFRALTVPKLLYIGEFDEFYSDVARNGAKEFPNTEVVVFEGMKHTDDYFPVAVPLLNSFLERHTGT
ncbi:MAG: alpha/beta fold hydrolase [Anaerolineae bacterium]